MNLEHMKHGRFLPVSAGCFRCYSAIVNAYCRAQGAGAEGWLSAMEKEKLQPNEAGHFRFVELLRSNFYAKREELKSCTF